MNTACDEFEEEKIIPYKGVKFIVEVKTGKITGIWQKKRLSIKEVFADIQLHKIYHEFLKTKGVKK